MSQDNTSREELIVSQAPVSQAGNDAQLLKMWLHGKSENTRAAYLRDVHQFKRHVDLPLSQITLGDLQNWADELEEAGLADTTRARKLAAVKSLFSFGHRIGYFNFNVGAAVTTPKTPDRLSERILAEADVKKLIRMAECLRDAVMLRLFYVSGARVSELARLRWRSLSERRRDTHTMAGQITLLGKGNKSRSVLLPPSVWDDICGLQQSEMTAGYGKPGDPVFRSRKGGPLTRQHIWRIVKDAAQRAGVADGVSPHWLRHAHASHALDRGAPTHLVKETLGHKSLTTTSRYAHARPGDSSSNYLDP